MNMTGTLKWHAKTVSADVERRARAALLDAADYVLEEANRTIPHDTGHMMSTGRATEGRGLEAFVSYDTPYAVRQHEDTRLRHDPGRRAKWLERTLVEQEERVYRYLAERIGKVF